MPKLTTETEIAVKLDPEPQARLHSSITQLLGLQEQIDLLTDVIDTEKTTIKLLMEEAGVDKTTVGDAYVNIVRGTSVRLNKKALVVLGVTEAQIEMATTRKPKRPYVLVETEAQRQAKTAKRGKGKSGDDEEDDD